MNGKYIGRIGFWRTLLLTAAVGTGAAFATAQQEGGKPPLPDRQPDAKQPERPPPSMGLKLGDAAPAFKLQDLDGKEVDIGALTKEGKIIVLEWFNPECDWVAKYHKDSRLIADTHKKFAAEGVKWFAIDSSSNAGASDAERHRKAKADWGIQYPILRDNGDRIARLYGAKVAPHIFIIGADGKIAYMGAVDDAATVTAKGTRNYLADALQSVVAGETVKIGMTPPQGCPLGKGDKPDKPPAPPPPPPEKK